jgi:hypothetical protein
VDRSDSELLLGKFDDQGHHPVLAARSVAPTGPHLTLVHQGRFVAVVPVCDHHRRGGHRLGDRRRVMLGDDPQLVTDAVVIVHVDLGFAARREDR